MLVSTAHTPVTARARLTLPSMSCVQPRKQVLTKTGWPLLPRPVMVKVKKEAVLLWEAVDDLNDGLSNGTVVRTRPRPLG